MYGNSSDRSVHLLHRPHENVNTVPPSGGTGQAASPSQSDFDWLAARNSEGI